MNTHAFKTHQKLSAAAAHQTSAKVGDGPPVSVLSDNSPESLQLRKLQSMADNSPQSADAAQLQAMADSSPHLVAQRMVLEGLADRPVQRLEAPKEELQMKAGPGLLQRQGMEEEALQMKAGPGLLQLQGMEEEELQMKAGLGSLQLQGMEEEDLQMKAAPGLIQRQGEEEEDLQMKAAPGLLQRQGEEEELQMKAGSGLIQRQGEEEELQMKAGPGLLQRQGMEEEALQMKAGRGSLQLQGMEEEELQMKASPGVLQRQGMEEEIQGKFEPVQKKENKTGMPDDLKSGVENLSGMSMDDVKVHYNSAKPAALQALAYTQGTDIHVGPGQEKHLPHEAWHVAQQKQGRVKPTMQIGGTRVNDDAKLEKEADVLGSLASANREWIDPHGISSSVHTITVQRSTAGNLRQAENNWSSVREIHDRATYETLPKYDDSVRERDGEIASAGLSSWTKTHLTTTSASFAELNQAADYESVHGVRGTLARTVRSMPDVTVESAKVKMAEEEKTSQSERQTDIDALIKDGHRQLGLSRSSAVTGVNTWRIVMKIQNRENPWPFTPTSIPIEDPFPYELGEAAKKRSLRHDKGLGIMRTQVEVYSARFGHFQFAI